MSRSEDIDFAFRGLNTSDNPAAQPAGACETADNVIFLGQNLVGPRRGFPTQTGPSFGALARVAPYAGAMVAIPQAGSVLATLQGGIWSLQPTIINYANPSSILRLLPPDVNNPIRFAQARGNLYFTTNTGVYRLDGPTAVPFLTGVGKPYIFGTSAIAGGAGAWVANGSSVAYRVVVGMYDANDNLLLGPPSEPIILTNSSGGLGLPSIIMLENSYQLAPDVVRWYFLYRDVSQTTTALLSDEMFLVDKVQVTGYVGAYTFQDTTTDAFLQASAYPLYTNPNTGQGIDHAHDPPPLAKDIVFWNRRMWYFNVIQKHRLDIVLRGVGAPSGLQVGDTVTVGGVVYTGVASGASYLNRTFVVYTAGSVAQNIEQTARNLADCVNNWTIIGAMAATVQTPAILFYTSGFYDPPGNLLLEEIGIGGSPITFSSSRAGTWVPQIPTGGLDSVAVTKPGRLMWSELDLPEAVPLDNFEDVADVAQEGYRVVPTQEALELFKADGLHRATGEPPNLLVLPHDLTAILAAPESAVPLKSSVFAFLTKGPALINNAGVTPLGDPLRLDFQKMQAQFRDAIRRQAWGIVSATDGRYILALPTNAQDIGASRQLVFDLMQLGWTRWTVPSAVQGVIDPADDRIKLIVGDSLLLEGKSLSSLDFNDNGAAFTSTIKFLPLHKGGPLDLKDWQTVYLGFKEAEFQTATVGLENEVQPMTQQFSASGPTPSTWGSFPWGTTPWGAPTRNWIIRTDVPKELAQSGLLGVSLSVSQANAFWSLQAVKATFEPSGGEITR